MQILSDQLVFSATDLANHLGCKHLTLLNKLNAEGSLETIFRSDPILDVLIERGLKHEDEYIQHLKKSGLSVVEIREFSGAAGIEKTRDAMTAGADVIVQAALQRGQWGGRADFLIKVDSPSELGDWSYEVTDAKLSQNTRAGTILQLCLYSEIVSGIQGTMPRMMSVVKPGEPFAYDSFRVDDFLSYYRLIKRQFMDAVESDSLKQTYPEPTQHCDVCRWWLKCNERRREDDHLTFVAGASKSHIAELRRQGINTLESLATAYTPLKERPKRGSRAVYDKIHRQAKLQFKSRKSGEDLYEFNEIEDGRGFCLLPQPDAGDVYFDLEGDPHVKGGVLEYLFGICMKHGEGTQYHYVWCLDRKSEKVAFMDFMKFLLDRWEANPDFHIYHYAPYEPAAMKRLAMRYAVYESELDRLLRAEKFVDLYAVTRQSMTLGVERYSIKNLEAFYKYERLAELEKVRPALHRVERALELGVESEIQEPDKDIVRVYNQDDCISTYELQKWLESRRAELADTGVEIARPERRYGEPTERVAELEAEVQAVFDGLVQGIDELPETKEENACWLLAHLLDYFRREDKCAWWEYFRRHNLEPEDLLYEKTAITGLTFEQEVPGGPRDRNPIHRYRFEPQEESLARGDQLVEVLGDGVGTVSFIDSANGIVDIKKSGKAIDVHPTSVFVHDNIRPDPMPESLRELGKHLIEHRASLDELKNARYDLLARNAPRLKDLALPLEGDLVDVATRVASALDNSVLPIQGPPGAGKTYVGSHMIAELAKAGKRIGVCAISHKVIANLLSRSQERLADTEIQIAHRRSKPSDDYPAGIEILKNTKAGIAAVEEGKVVGGTAWLWSNHEMEDKLDYLFIDEAGQMSLAIALAASRCAKNLILLGDPQQLEQPQLGSHPEGAEVAALNHLLDGSATIAPDRGLFLDTTWRLCPSICQFTSEQFYDGRLESQSGLERQEVFGPSPFIGHGLIRVEVDHEGNQNRSYEEIEVISKIVDQILDGEHQWSDMEGELKTIGEDDILVVAPFNAQVNALQKELGDRARVGTVDKFQGQEAPIVIYSTASSSAEEAPRGMSFLYNPNRLNVATSRARCLAIIVSSPKLFEPECRTPGQIQLANAFCRFAEQALEQND